MSYVKISQRIPRSVACFISEGSKTRPGRPSWAFRSPFARFFGIASGYGHTELTKSNQFRGNLNGHPKDYFGGECLTIYYNRLRRDGWAMSDKEYQGATLFEKKLPKGWLLRKLAFSELNAPAGRGCYWDAHELRHESTNAILAFPEWEWADFVDGRLIFATEGKLCAARLGRGKVVGEKLLHDFNNMKFEAIAAPY